MGIFGGSKEVFVSSVAYNMAGDEVNRPQYLKTLVIRNVLSNSKQTIADTINSGYLNGPGIKFRSFFRWAEQHYNEIGIPSGKLASKSSINTALLTEQIPVAAGETVWVQDGDVGGADYGRWVEQYMLKNHPSLLNTNWYADINDGNNLITITFEDNSMVSFVPLDFNINSQYIYAYYSYVGSQDVDSVEIGPIVVLATGDPYPPTAGWVMHSDTTVVEGAASIKTIEWRRETYLGSVGRSSIKKLREFMFFIERTEGAVLTRSYRVDTQEVTTKSWSDPYMYIYRIGSGNINLDNSFQEIENYGAFFPFIPVRIENEFLSESFNPSAYALAKKAYRKGTGGKFDDLVKDLKENDNIGDIDFAYIVYGVSLNVKENACRKYLYIFFKKMMESQIGGPNIYENWLAEKAAAQAASEEWQIWKNAQNDPTSELYGDPEPEVNLNIDINTVTNEIRIDNSGPFNTNYDIRIEWKYIREFQQNGVGRPGAKRGDHWLVHHATQEYISNVRNTSNNDNDYYIPQITKIEVMRIYKQINANQFSYLEVVGMIHRNYVYGSKFVEINTKEALEDNDESGFIVPLHNGTYKDMPLVDSTQMATACCFIVLNCYKVVKTKWYESGIFRIIIVVAVAVVGSLFTGGAALGVLGTSLSVGTALGFSGLTAIIMGAVVNALAAVVLATIVDTVATGLFGAQLGAIIGAIISFAIMQGINSFSTSGSFTMNWGDLMKVDNIMMITDAVGKGYAAYVQGDIQKLTGRLEQYNKQASDDLERIQKQYNDEFGYGIGFINPIEIANSTNYLIESGDTFLTRTLMTGSEIAGMSIDMLNGFADLTLTLPDAYT